MTGVIAAAGFKLQSGVDQVDLQGAALDGMTSTKSKNPLYISDVEALHTFHFYEGGCDVGLT